MQENIVDFYFGLILIVASLASSLIIGGKYGLPLYLAL